MEIAATELRIVLESLGSEFVDDIERVSEGRSQLLRFQLAAEPENLAAICGQLSASAAMFRHVDNGHLEPMPIAENLVYSPELVTTQRYKGKTNERLTRAMLNIALASAGVNPVAPKGTLLDPMCGRGTTLNWALAYGLSGVGIELDRRSLDQHATFLEGWGKRKRLPHKMQKFKAKSKDKSAFQFDVGPNRSALKESPQQVKTFNADAADEELAIKKSKFDVVVCDLPYGVQHQGGDHADTAELLERILPTWHRWLRDNGSVCIAWNTKRAARRDVSRLFAQAGFTPVTVNGGHTMAHTVDATIDRDVLLAVAS